MTNFDDRLRSVFASAFGIDADALTDEHSPETIAEWDSLSHLTLVLALEAEFGVQFDAEDIPTLTTVGAIRHRLLATA